MTRRAVMVKKLESYSTLMKYYVTTFIYRVGFDPICPQSSPPIHRMFQMCFRLVWGRLYTSGLLYLDFAADYIERISPCLTHASRCNIALLSQWPGVWLA